MKSILIFLSLFFTFSLLEANDSLTFIDAAAKGDLPTIKRNIENGIDINTSDEDGNTALHLAVIKGNLELTQYLIQKGAKINQKDGNGDTPLANACVLGNVEIAKYLIEHGAEIDSKNQYGWTPLRLASNEGYMPLVNFLLEKGADLSPLYIADKLFLDAAKNGDLDGLKKYLTRGASVNAVDSEGNTALLYVTKPQDKPFINTLEMVKLLIESGADLEDRNTIGETALQQAILTKNDSVIYYLIEKGSNLESSDANGNTILITSVLSENLKLLQFLIKKKVDLNILNAQGKSPLYLASEFGKTEAAKILLNYPVEIDLIVEESYNKNYTPLLIASKNGNEKIVSLLLEKKANINYKTKNNQETALILAAANGHLSVVKILLENGADINIKSNGYPYGTALEIAQRKGYNQIADLINLHKKSGSTPRNSTLHKVSLENLIQLNNLISEEIKGRGKDGFTALHWACSKGNKEIVQLLLNSENINAKTKEGLTPLHYAIKTENLEIVKLLVAAGADKESKDKKGNTPLATARKTIQDSILKIYSTTPVTYQ